MALLPVAGCASTSAQDSYQDVEKTIEQRTGHRIYWHRDAEADGKVRAAVRKLLADGLSSPEAVQIALLNNGRLQAEYEELSVAQADLVQAGLLSNPTFSGRLGFPLEGGGQPDIGAGVEVDFLSLLFLPGRKRMAGAQLEAAKSRVGAEVLELAAQVKIMHLRVQAAQQLTALLRVVAAAGQAAAELAARQHDAGNIGDFELAGQQAVYEDARLALARAEAEVLDVREELNRLLGLWGADTRWSASDRLPDLPPADPSLAKLESLAMTQRLDVEAARRGLSVAAMSSSFGASARWAGSLEAGAEVEREDGEWEAGPSARVGLPIFDQGQAGVAKLEALQRQARHRLAFVAVNARADVRQARNRLVTSRGLCEHYRQVVVPGRERLVRLAQQHFDAMLIGAYQLLELKRDEIEAYREYVVAVRDYWIARAELERAVGGRLPPPDHSAPARGPQRAPPPAGAAPPPATPTAPEHRH
ncbi:MAG: TolC family protein [Polyangiaceae bacterium]